MSESFATTYFTLDDQFASFSSYCPTLALSGRYQRSAAADCSDSFALIPLLNSATRAFVKCFSYASNTACCLVIGSK
jgi:hypothetical protein